MGKLKGFYPACLFLLAIAGLCSCSFLTGSDPDPKNSKFKIDFHLPGWMKIDPDHSDTAYRHKISKSILLANSTCKKYDTTSLESLADNLFAGIDELKTGTGERIPYAGREAFRISAEGKMDGVPIYLLVVTLKRDQCIYDFSLVSPNKEAHQKETADFERFLSSARFD